MIKILKIVYTDEFDEEVTVDFSEVDSVVCKLRIESILEMMEAGETEDIDELKRRIKKKRPAAPPPKLPEADGQIPALPFG